MAEQNSTKDGKSRRKFIAGAAGAGLLGTGAVGGVAASGNLTDTLDWVFSLFNSTRKDTSVAPTSVSTLPPGRAIGEATISFENTASESARVSILFEIAGEDGSNSMTVEQLDGNETIDGNVQFTSDGWPYFEDEFESQEKQAYHFDFDKVYDGVGNDELKVTVEEVVE